MKYRRRIYYSSKQKNEMWDRWQRGESLKSIGRAFNRGSSSVYSVLSRHGGIRPPTRARSRVALSLAEREEISRGIASDLSLRAIALQLGRAPSTISREVKRNGGRDHYRASSAEQLTWDRAHRPKHCKLADSPFLRRTISAKLRLGWAPQQIAGWLKRTYPGDETKHVSHETIYRSLFIQARGVLKKELFQYLRTQRTIRRSKQATLKNSGLGQIKNMASIRQRPASVEDRALPGHWEGDLIAGFAASYIATLVERQSRFTMLIKVNGKDTNSVVTALSKQVRKLPSQLRQSLTWDRGMELADHKTFTLATDTQVYFCDPRSPWQRGTNENTNRLLRQYFPKGADLSVYSQAELNKVARKLNQRPRKTLGYKTPADTLQASVASIS